MATLRERTLQFIRENPGYDAIEIAVKIGTKPRYLRIRQLEDEGLIRWDLNRNGWVAEKEEEVI